MNLLNVLVRPDDPGNLYTPAGNPLAIVDIADAAAYTDPTLFTAGFTAADTTTVPPGAMVAVLLNVTWPSSAGSSRLEIEIEMAIDIVCRS